MPIVMALPRTQKKHRNGRNRRAKHLNCDDHTRQKENKEKITTLKKHSLRPLWFGPSASRPEVRTCTCRRGLRSVGLQGSGFLGARFWASGLLV